MGCTGLHCGGCHGGGGPAAAVDGVAGHRRGRSAEGVAAVVHQAEIAAWTVAGITGAAIVVTGGVLTARVASSYGARRAMQRRFTTPAAGAAW